MKGVPSRRNLLNIDRVYAVIGDCGRQQLKYCLLIFFGQLHAACQMVHNVIVGQRVDFYCVQKDGVRVGGGDETATRHSNSICIDHLQGRCDRFVFVGEWKTIVEEVCFFSSVLPEALLALCSHLITQKSISLQSMHNFLKEISRCIFEFSPHPKSAKSEKVDSV